MPSKQQLIKDGYSSRAIAIKLGGPVGSPEYYKVLKELDPKMGKGCPYCKELCFGTGDCNCQERDT